MMPVWGLLKWLLFPDVIAVTLCVNGKMTELFCLFDIVLLINVCYNITKKFV